MRVSMATNKSLVSLDLRKNPGCLDAVKAISEIEKYVHYNEHASKGMTSSSTKK